MVYEEEPFRAIVFCPVIPVLIVSAPSVIQSDSLEETHFAGTGSKSHGQRTDHRTGKVTASTLVMEPAQNSLQTISELLKFLSSVPAPSRSLG